MDVYLESGKKKTFACAIDWPGWSRSGRDEEGAIEALLAYAGRYASVLDAAGLQFEAPPGPSALRVVERLEGNATTDFGAPGIVPNVDLRAVDGRELARFEALLRAYWQAFDAARSAAAGRELRKGPRGGGRELEGIVEHVLGADAGYLAQLGWKLGKDKAPDPDGELRRLRAAILEALPAAARGELPARGPRGGLRWPARYFVRRAGWHVLDHLWEIEDRVEGVE
jgi:hypothetical protein